MTQIAHGERGSAQPATLAGALVRTADGTPKVLHLSLPRLPMRARAARRWLRQQINDQTSAAPEVPVVFHRMRRDGGMTNERAWLAWL